MSKKTIKPPRTESEAAEYLAEAGALFANADKMRATLEQKVAELKLAAEPKIAIDERDATRFLRAVSIFWRLRGRKLALPLKLLRLAKAGLIKDRLSAKQVEVTDEEALIKDLRDRGHTEAIEETFSVRKKVLLKLLQDNPDLWEKLAGMRAIEPRLLTYVIPEEGPKQLAHDPLRKPRWFIKEKD